MARKDTYARKLKDARARHDARFEIDYPKPTLEGISQVSTRLEKATGYMWVIWLLLAVAGAIISAPHTLATLRAVLPGASELGLVIYSIAGFVGIELGLIGLALVSALKQREHTTRKVRSLKGLANALSVRGGNTPRYDLSHLPDRVPSAGGVLVGGLFCAALIFNQVDALHDVLGRQHEAMLLLSRAVTGVLGPGLLLISGHRFAHEVVKSGQRAQRDRLASTVEKWQRKRQESWKATGEEWIGERQEFSPAGQEILAPTRELSTSPTQEFSHQAERNIESETNAKRELASLPEKTQAQVLNCVSFYNHHPYAPLRELALHLGVSTPRAGKIRQYAVECGKLEKGQGRQYILVSSNGHHVEVLA